MRNDLRTMFRSPEIRRQIRELKKERREGTIRAKDVEQRIDAILTR